MKKLIGVITLAAVALTALSCARKEMSEELGMRELSEYFDCPPQEFGPYVWWHWLGTDYTLSGIEKDLEAMKESGIAGATIFNVTSDVHEPSHGILNSPWPDQTYRSEAYWNALEHAAATAQRLGLKLGIHNAPGYATTGGPWIDEQRGMQTLVFSETTVNGGDTVRISLPKPEMPVSRGWGGTGTPATRYSDLAVMAVPDGSDATPAEIMDITSGMDENGFLTWDAPAGGWKILRIGQAPDMSSPHPLPEDLIGKTLEADKMSREASEYHWDNMLEPLKEHLGQYFGETFTHVLIDSYEAPNQKWTDGFREEFQKECGYDPLPFMAFSFCGRESGQSFNDDMDKVVNNMYFKNGWCVARDKIHEAGLQFFWEPYTGPFDVTTGAAIADVPMGEFWTDSDGTILPEIVQSAYLNHKKIVGAEAFTGKAYVSGYTEDPAFLKNLTDAAFACGVNLLFLHHWTHQALDDCYKPGLSMGTWGTHFGRNQTWFEPGKAYFRYIARCQMMLRQGELMTTGKGSIQRSTNDAEIFFITNPGPEESVKSISCEFTSSKPQLWDAYTGKIYDAAPLTKAADGLMTVSVNLKPSQSMFVVFDKTKGLVRRAEKLFVPEDSRAETVTGNWDVLFKPATMEPEFEVKDFSLADFSSSDNADIRYFAGTAVYSKTVDINPGKGGSRVLLDLGEMNDIAAVKINGKDAGVLWNPPYVGDISEYLRSGKNTLEIEVSVNWANRLIGDECCKPDVEWHEKAPGEWALTAFPDWLVNGTERPSKGRKAFSNYTYYTSSSPFEKAGLAGPVRLIFQNR